MELEALVHLRRVAALAGVDATDAALPASHHAVMSGRRFHYLEWGAAAERPPVLFLHGGNQSAHTWDVVCLALSRRYHCVALDQRGHGDSEWSYELDYRPEAHARAISIVPRETAGATGSARSDRATASANAAARTGSVASSVSSWTSKRSTQPSV